jgi:hypothetical protein
MDTTIESFEHAGLRVEIGYEEDASPFNPREAECNLGRMVCWHPDYMLGDAQLRDGGGRGAVTVPFETAHGRSDFRDLATLERYLRLVDGAVCILPLYLLDHSGISMSAGANYVGRGDTASGGRDSWGNPRGWDTTMVGFIYTTAERIRELCGEPQLESDPFYCPRTWPADGRSGKNWPAERSAVEWIATQLDCEVSTYDAYLRGEVYYYLIKDADGEVLDACGGFLGGDNDQLEYLQQEAREAADCARQERDRRRVEIARGWALAHGQAVV